MEYRFFSLPTRPIGCDRATKSAAEETPFTRSTGELFLNSCLSSRVCGTPPSTSPINRSTPIYNSLQLEKRSLAFLFSLLFFFVCLFFSSRLTLLARNLAPYLGQIAPVAVFTAREGARSVYPGVFGRAVLATLPIGLPRPFLLRRAADIGPTVKTHCLFPPSLREPDGHATYTQRHENDRWLVPVCVCVCLVDHAAAIAAISRFRPTE